MKTMHFVSRQPIDWREIAKYVVIGFIIVVAAYFGST